MLINVRSGRVFGVYAVGIIMQQLLTVSVESYLRISETEVSIAFRQLTLDQSVTLYPY